MILKLDGEGGYSGVTPKINYTPEPIDEYLVMVNLPEDWEEIHNYIINENEIDGIPNRKITCSNTQSFSLRSAIYEMSVEEANILRTHEKVDSIELNPEKYPQPQSLFDLRFRKNIAFNKPPRPATFSSTSYTNGVRGNWGHLFVNNPSSEPYQGVGIVTTDSVDRDLSYSLSGKNIDVVTIDSGVGALHPEFLDVNGKSKVKDVILDGPFKVDPDYFIGLGVTYTKVLDGVDIGVGIATTSAEEWWENTSKRSSTFSSLGTITIPSSYTLSQALSKTSGVEPNYINNAHGTACASTTCGKSFGLAFNSNVWTIRITLGTDSVNGVISSSVALNACAIWHQAKKLNSTDPDPTLINNSYGSSSETGNTSGTSYNHVYRGSNLTYTGTGSVYNVASNAGACRNTKTFTRNTSGSSSQSAYSGSGGFINSGNGSTGSAAENAIASGCIVVAAAGNENQKLSDKDDVDFDNSYVNAGVYINRVGGVQQGFSGDHEPGKGSIRVGAIDCGVEPFSEKQGVTKYKIRKAVYSNNGPMIDIFAPAEMTMCGAYGSDENYQRQDNSNFYDDWFNGTSCAAPQVCGVIALYLESNRKANQDNVRYWLNTSASKEGQLSDPYSGVNDVGYWSQTYNSTYDEAELGESYNVRGNGNLRGAPNRVLYNPYANNYKSSFFISRSSIITTNLVLHLDASNNNSYSGSGTTWTDLSGQGNNATLVNNPTYSSDNGGYLSFDGTNDHATLPIIDISGDEVTFTVWNYGISTQYSYLFNLHGSNQPILRILLPYPYPSGTNQIYFDKGTGSGYDRINFGATNSEYQGWHHWAFTANATTGSMKIYLDGVLKHSGTGKTASLGTPTGTPQAIGYGALGYYHKGYISQILLYKKELTASEVLQNYNATKSNYVGLITTNLVLHLDASNSNSYSGSGTTWTDLSGEGNNGTLVNGVSYSSDNGGYLIFDGTDDKVTLPVGSDFAYGTGDFTVEMWFNVTDTSPQTYGQRLFCQTESGTNYFVISASRGDPVVKKPVFTYTLYGGGTHIVSSTAYTEGTWHHLIITRNGTTATLYLDNSSVATATVSLNFNNTTYVPTIGAFTHSNQLNFDGKISQVRIYKGKGFSASDVTQNYNATKSNYVESTTNKITFNNLQIGLPPILPKLKIIREIVTTNLILHLDAGNNSSYGGSGSTWTDLSGEGNNATLVNSPTYNSGNGGYFDFDGSNDYVTLPTLDIAGNEFTFSVWNYGIEAKSSSIIFLGDSGQTEGGRIFQAHVPWSNRFVYFDKGWNGTAYDRIFKRAENSEYQGWHHWAFTANASTGSMKIYLDATLWHSGTGKTKTFSNVNGNERKIATNHNGQYHRGYISNLQIYTKELSASEVFQNYDAAKSRFGL